LRIWRLGEILLSQPSQPLVFLAGIRPALSRMLAHRFAKKEPSSNCLLDSLDSCVSPGWPSSARQKRCHTPGLGCRCERGLLSARWYRIHSARENPSPWPSPRKTGARVLAHCHLGTTMEKAAIQACEAWRANDESGYADHSCNPGFPLFSLCDFVGLLRDTRVNCIARMMKYHGTTDCPRLRWFQRFGTRGSHPAAMFAIWTCCRVNPGLQTPATKGA
jgi:hypothetical protein